MKETIRELFYGNIFPCEMCGNNNHEIKKITKRLNEAREKLCEGFTEEQIALLEIYDDVSLELHAIFNEEFFVDGFSLGAKIVKEAIE